MKIWGDRVRVRVSVGVKRASVQEKRTEPQRLYLDGFLRGTGPLLVVLGLLVLLAPGGQVGVVGQTAEQRGHHGAGVHLVLGGTEVDTRTEDESHDPVEARESW